LVLLSLAVLSLFIVSSSAATTISVRGHSNYGQGGPGEQLGSLETLSLPDGTILTAQAECPTAGPDSNGNCDLMFIYVIKSLGSSVSSLTVSFTGLSNFEFNTNSVGILGIDDANNTPMSSLPGIDSLGNASIDATGSVGNVSFNITNPFVGLNFFFTDSASTQVCNFGTDDNQVFDCSDLDLTLAQIPTPNGVTSTPEPGTALLTVSGLLGIWLVLRRGR
jgi:hypothetical protein